MITDGPCRKHLTKQLSKQEVTQPATECVSIFKWYGSYCQVRVSKGMDPDHTVRVSNGMDPNWGRHSVGPDLGPNCLQMLSADVEKEGVNRVCIFCFKMKTLYRK